MILTYEGEIFRPSAELPHQKPPPLPSVEPGSIPSQWHLHQPTRTGRRKPRSIRQLRGAFLCGKESAARIPILIICVVPTIRCIAAGALTGSVRVHAATSRRSRIGGARCCSASCACRSTSATGTSSRSAAGATGATTSRSAASATTAAALSQRGRTGGDCCKQRKSEYFSYRHAGLHVGVSFMETANTRIVPVLVKRQRGPALSD